MLHTVLTYYFEIGFGVPKQYIDFYRKAWYYQRERHFVAHVGDRRFLSLESDFYENIVTMLMGKINGAIAPISGHSPEILPTNLPTNP